MKLSITFQITIYFLISCVYLTANAQTIIEREGIEYIFQKNFSKAEENLALALKENPNSTIAQFGLAKALYEKEQATKKKEVYTFRFKNFQPYFDMLYNAYQYSLQASDTYMELSDTEKAKVRQSASASEDEILSYLTARIEKEGYMLIYNAPYRRNTAQLYGTGVYNRTTDAEKIMALRENLIRQCGEYIENFPSSPYNEQVSLLRKEILSEYTQIKSLRQYGDRSGKMYEKYCKDIIALYSKNELKHILPNFYGEEYSFDANFKSRSENYKKLQTLAEKYNLTVIELLCKLNIHYGGCNDASANLYDEFIKALAPADIALVAIQRKAKAYIDSASYAKAISIYNTYKPLFPRNAEYFDKTITLLSTPERPHQSRNLGTNINHLTKDFQPIISLDGSHLYFARKTADTGEDVYYSYKNNNGKWSKAKPLSPNINTVSHEIPVGISADGQTIFLYGNYSKLKKFSYVNSTEKRLGKGDFYYAQKDSLGNWNGLNVFPYPINTPNYEAGLSMTADGQAVLFCSDREGTVGKYNPNYNPEKLYYHGAGEFNLDLYVCPKNADGSWGTPINLGAIINTPFAEKNPYLHPDMETLYFCSDGHYGLGGYDIFMSKRLNKNSWTEWSKPVNMGKVLNTTHDDAFYLTPTGKTALIVSAGMEKNYGKEDIYEVEIPKDKRPSPIIFVPGTLTNKKGKPIKTNLFVVEKDNKDNTQKVSTNSDGSFLLILEPGKEYFYYPEKDNFFSSGIELNLTDKDKANILERNKLELTSLNPKDKKREPLILKTLHFDTDSDHIRSESYFDLNRLAEYIKSHKKLHVKINGHTDNIADEKFNLDLSKRRAVAVKNYLIKRGCKEERLITKGFGEHQPTASNNTPSGRQKNRRVEFIVY